MVCGCEDACWFQGCTDCCYGSDTPDTKAQLALAIYRKAAGFSNSIHQHEKKEYAYKYLEAALTSLDGDKKYQLVMDVSNEVEFTQEHKRMHLILLDSLNKLKAAGHAAGGSEYDRRMAEIGSNERASQRAHDAKVSERLRKEREEEALLAANPALALQQKMHKESMAKLEAHTQAIKDLPRY
jgi:hypothetical protein